MTTDDVTADLMRQWTEALQQQHMMPVLLLGVEVDDPTNTGLFLTEGVDDEMAAAVLDELSKRMQREAVANSGP